MTDESNANVPFEIYDFKFTHEDAITLLRHQRKPHVRALILILLFVGCIFFLYISEEWAIPLAVAAFIFSGLPQIIVLSKFKKSWEKTYLKLITTAYHYEIFDTYLIVTVLRNDKMASYAKINLWDIDKIHPEAPHLILTIGNQLYVLRLSDVPNTSVLYKPRPSPATSGVQTAVSPQIPPQEPVLTAEPVLSSTQPPLTTVEPPKMPKKSKLTPVSWILFIASFISLSVAGRISTIFNTNIFILIGLGLGLIPLASLIVGIIMVKKGLKGAKNIVVGIVIIVLLAMLTSFNFLIKNSFYNYDDYDDPTPVYKAEELFNIDIPEYETLYTTSTQTEHPNGYIHYNTYVTFSEYDADTFMLRVPNDSRWKSQIPNALVGISSPYNRSYPIEDDYVLIYNIDTGEYNTLPSEEGTYRFISLIFNPAQNSLTIIEYDVEYVK